MPSDEQKDEAGEESFERFGIHEDEADAPAGSEGHEAPAAEESAERDGEQATESTDAHGED